MTETELVELIEKITYKEGYFVNRSGRWTIRVGFHRPDAFTNEPGIGYGGSATIDPAWTKADVVRTVFGLYKALEEHECREWFKVDGVQVFSPHIEYDALLAAGRHIQGHPEVAHA